MVIDSESTAKPPVAIHARTARLLFGPFIVVINADEPLVDISMFLLEAVLPLMWPGTANVMTGARLVALLGCLDPRLTWTLIMFDVLETPDVSMAGLLKAKAVATLYGSLICLRGMCREDAVFLLVPTLALAVEVVLSAKHKWFGLLMDLHVSTILREVIVEMHLLP